jgi:uncharacterized protein YndB with AHSA1/START domain
MRVTSQTTVVAPIDTVWDALSNHSGISRWAPGLTVTMDRLGTADPNGVGAIRRIASPGPGPDIVEEVVTFEPPHLLGYEALSGTPFPGYAGEVRLSEAGAGTHISYTIPPPQASRWSRRPSRCYVRCCSACSRAHP